MTDGTSTYFGAIYSHVGFPVPESSYKTYLANPKNQYFTFEIGNYSIIKIKDSRRF